MISRNDTRFATWACQRVLFAYMRRTNAEIAALWEIYERAKERECAEQ